MAEDFHVRIDKCSGTTSKQKTEQPNTKNMNTDWKARKDAASESHKNVTSQP
ncbi:hypothetical protein PRUPE_6G134500 [Prunus persica]|uniref:Uncharacterized protein n=1 Tax=Prunus persica TaxID=3760 RepID=A0A251NPV0_PRUPE|nr:hypothetical protein PRUPE_6G134500 [Prunus persica]